MLKVIVASEITSILSLKQLARQSLEVSLPYHLDRNYELNKVPKYSSLDAKDKEKAIELWEKRWNAYIEDIITSVAP
jgi:hypothetical protein